ncbi:MAG TPA: hypothetical protein VGR58_00810 [Candidatus Acidoferrum sp.]|nr:hypothetical protein [Candidatus Acidoferrum sp.]
MLPMILNLNLNLDTTISRAWDAFLSIFGKDAETVENKKWIETLTREAFVRARDVQCLGMHTPVLLSEIFQPTRLIQSEPETIAALLTGREWDAPQPQVISLDRFLSKRSNSIIIAGPGWGKTTLLHAVFLHFLCSSDGKVFPILFTLRQTDAVADLQKFVRQLDVIKKRDPERRILLLVDGYDEITSDARKMVSEALFRFSAASVGNYFLTCRDFYEIFDLKAPLFHIMQFTTEDQVRFVTTILRVYGWSANADEMVTDLAKRGLDDLLRHPLLLTLACIAKSSSLNFNAKNIVSLIEAAIQTLVLRWDQGKGLKREGATPLDGTARLKILKRIAFHIELEPVRQQRVVELTRKQLERTRLESLDPLVVLHELAQFYGMLVPMGSKWGFVHRTLQDYLGAQYWVETGLFASDVLKGSVRPDSRTAYAACMMEDATSVMETILKLEDGLPVFADMLMNDAAFDHARIARVIVEFCEKYKGKHYYRRTDEKIECHLADDFVSDASSKFLDYIVQVCGPTRGKTTDTLTSYAIVELVRRKIPLTKVAYSACTKNFARENFGFDVLHKNSSLRLSDVPHL